MRKRKKHVSKKQMMVRVLAIFLASLMALSGLYALLDLLF